MFTKISDSFGARLKSLVDGNVGQVGRSITPFGHRPIPQGLSDGADLIPFELTSDLDPCGYASACRYNLDTDEADYSDTFIVRDFMSLSGIVGDRGWVDHNAINTPGEGSDSGAEPIYPIVNIGPRCGSMSGSSESGSEESQSAESGSVESGSIESGSEESESFKSGSEESGSAGPCHHADSMGYPVPFPDDGGSYIPAFDQNGCFRWLSLGGCDNGSLSDSQQIVYVFPPL